MICSLSVPFYYYYYFGGVEATPSDGCLSVAILPAVASRQELYGMHRSLRAGLPLSQHERVDSFVAKEVQFQPGPDCFGRVTVDGEDFELGSVHIKVLPGRLTVFAAG